MQKTSYLLSIYFILSNLTLYLSAQDPLPSWNEGEAKKAIIEFVQKSTSENTDDYIPIDQRIATFDQDGTLWIEKPIYTQLAFTISRIKELEALHPEWKSQPPYQAILDDDWEKMQQFSLQDIEKIVASTHTNITTTEFKKQVDEWLKIARHPRFKKPYTELIYQPMLELINYLKEHQYKVYIVSGGGQDFIRTYSDKIYGIPSEQIIGSAGRTRYNHYKATPPSLTKLPEILLVDDNSGKPEAMHLFIGKHPVFAAGNSDGDKAMLEWSQATPKKSFQLLVHHDDPIREYAYDVNSKIGTFSESLKKEAIKNKWVIVSMKNDWQQIFPSE